MAYNVELSESAERELGKLDASQAKRILKFLHQRVAKLDDPRSIGEALHGSRLGEFWKYRVGDFGYGWTMIAPTIPNSSCSTHLYW
jgi:mRNA interferase RelE/StbE